MCVLRQPVTAVGSSGLDHSLCSCPTAHCIIAVLCSQALLRLQPTIRFHRESCESYRKGLVSQPTALDVRIHNCRKAGY